MAAARIYIYVDYYITSGKVNFNVLRNKIYVNFNGLRGGRGSGWRGKLNGVAGCH